MVIGASAGGVTALLRLCAALPRFFPAPICVVQHVGALPSILPELLRHQGPNHAVHAEQDQNLLSGTIYVAPPDHHMLVEGEVLRLSRGAKENHARPAIDPLFRTAALSWGARCIGVVLTGQLDDGAAGLKAIKDCGGVAIVQDPADAAEPDMPLSALASTEADHCLPLDGIAPLLLRLAGAPQVPAAVAPPERLVREVALTRGGMDMENLDAIADLSPLTCPDCHGSLWEVRGEQPLRYRCHTGHAFGMRSLAHSQAEAAEEALWGGVRALREREMLLRRSASVAAASGDAAQAAAGTAQADRLQARIRELVALTEGMPGETGEEGAG